jgi:hypothetical protein
MDFFFFFLIYICIKLLPAVLDRPGGMVTTPDGAKPPLAAVFRGNGSLISAGWSFTEVACPLRNWRYTDYLRSLVRMALHV